MYRTATATIFIVLSAHQVGDRNQRISLKAAFNDFWLPGGSRTNGHTLSHI